MRNAKKYKGQDSLNIKNPFSTKLKIPPIIMDSWMMEEEED